MTAASDQIRALVRSEGAITVERYMALCLGAYYSSRDPLGRAGDFTTAPEISQMFGELLGVWAGAVWQAVGRPAGVRLVELGPGRGTLMADALRALARVPGFREAATIHLVETSPALRERQRAALPGAIAWHESLEEVPDGPAILLANEFFDALPIRQFVGTARGWHERIVEADGEGLRFGMRPDPDAKVTLSPRPGAVLERAGAGLRVAEVVARRLVRTGGAALIVDYGHCGGAFGDTLQAVKAHAFAEPLAEPGEADLTAHVDFSALAETASAGGAAFHGPAGQGRFLTSLGIETRAAALRARATASQAAAINAALRRLCDPGAMGELFKVVAFSHPSLNDLPGLVRQPLRT